MEQERYGCPGHKLIGMLNCVDPRPCRQDILLGSGSSETVRMPFLVVATVISRWDPRMSERRNDGRTNRGVAG
jgi:hypothetical protein